jgi:hypothetical protein
VFEKSYRHFSQMAYQVILGDNGGNTLSSSSESSFGSWARWLTQRLNRPAGEFIVDALSPSGRRHQAASSSSNRAAAPADLGRRQALQAGPAVRTAGGNQHQPMSFSNRPSHAKRSDACSTRRLNGVAGSSSSRPSISPAARVIVGALVRTQTELGLYSVPSFVIF